MVARDFADDVAVDAALGGEGILLAVAAGVLGLDIRVPAGAEKAKTVGVIDGVIVDEGVEVDAAGFGQGIGVKPALEGGVVEAVAVGIEPVGG